MYQPKPNTPAIATAALTVFLLVMGSSGLSAQDTDEAQPAKATTRAADSESTEEITAKQKDTVDNATRSSERLRHKGRAATDSDAAKTHTPEWTNPAGSDPGTNSAGKKASALQLKSAGASTGKESGEKGGTIDINIGVGELNEGDEEEMQRRTTEKEDSSE